MTAQELIKALQNVAPDTDVTITTESGTKKIADFLTTGYTGGSATIVAED